MRDLSVIITARNEEFLSRTVEDVLVKKRGNTEVIVILDGNWANPPLKDHSDLTVIYHSESIGQRAACNEGAKLSQAKFIMKLDAHCIVDEGFDIKLMADCEYEWTVVPAQYNLHAFDWKCKKCGNQWYQSPTPTYCQNPGEKRGKNEKCDSKEFERVIVWQPRLHRRSEFMRFDTDLHFQYFGSLSKRESSKGDLAETMSFVGACWLLHRKRYWELGGSEELWGSWGQQGTEWACKTWLSGGRVMVNKKTWFAHMFRTQGGDFGFPYPQSGRQVEKARKMSKDMFYNNKFAKQVRPLSWLIEHFKPLPEWHEEKGKVVLEMVNKKGEEFKALRKEPTKGIIYYTNSSVPTSIGVRVRRQIAKAELPIVSTSLKPLDFGKNIVLALQSGWEAYFKQILTALENSTSDIVYFCEHDCLYSPSHFEFTPPKKDVFYYDMNWWRVRISDGFAISYRAFEVPFICGYRELLLGHYKKVYESMRKANFSKEMAYLIGFEPGACSRDERVDNFKAEGYMARNPSFDIRHQNNTTRSRWSQKEFRNPRSCRDWKETHFENIFKQIK